MTTAAGGGPLAGICVEAYPVTGSVGSGSATTTSDGSYAIGGLNAGSYSVSFQTCIAPYTYVTQYYSNKDNQSVSDPVVVADGTPTAGIGAAMVLGGSISGTVTAATGGAGLLGVCVDAAVTGGGQGFGTATTAADGSYKITGLGAGTYTVGFLSCGGPAAYVSQWFNNKATQATAVPVSVTSGVTTPGVNAQMTVGGSISGTVTASVGGAPVAGICVDVTLAGGGVGFGNATTSDTGTYTISDLAGGSYTVEFQSCGGVGDYLDQWYNGKQSQGNADTVAVVDGVPKTGINAAMVAAGSISGTVTAAVGGAFAAGICVNAHGSLGGAGQATTAPDGTYTISGLPEESYQVSFDAQGACLGGVVGNYVTQWYKNQASQLSASPVVVSSGSTMSGISATMVASGVTGEMSGTVESASTKPAALPGICVIATPLAGGIATGNATTDSNGIYKIAGLAPGDYTVEYLSCGGGVSFVTQWYDNEGSQAAGDPVPVTGGAVTPVDTEHLLQTTSFTITVDGGPAATLADGTPATLAESGLPADATGTVDFSTSTPDGVLPLCTVQLPATATSCLTSIGLGLDAYPSISATFTDAGTDGAYAGSTASNDVSLTLATAPGPPTSVTATSSSGQAALSWTAPTDNGGTAVTDYLVAPAVAGVPQGPVDTHSTVTAFTVTGLDNGTAYSFTVQAVNALSVGPVSGVSNAITPAAPPPSPPPTPVGYRLVASDGGIFAYGDAGFFGSTGALRLNRPIVGMTATSTGRGYWLVASDGGIFAFGDAGFFGSTGALRLNRPIVGMTATSTGKGYWLVASDGGIFAFGDAGFFGSTGALRLNRPIVGMTATSSGRGYWLVASDGGIFAFGDAGFYGSAGALHLTQPIVAMTAPAGVDGYLMVAADGGIFAFGGAGFYGSAGALKLSKPIVDVTATAGGKGYWLVASDGGIFSYGDATFLGSTGAVKLNEPIVGMSGG